METYPSWDKSAHWVRVYRARIRLGLEQCRLCGVTNDWGTGQQLTLDHIHPRSKGGTSLIYNATILCARCNCAKGDKPAVYTKSLWAEEQEMRRRHRPSLRPVPEVPDGPWDQPQPPRTRRGQRRALERRLPEWARELYSDYPPGEVPEFVLKLAERRVG